VPEFALLVPQADDKALPETWRHEMLPMDKFDLFAIKYVIKSSKSDLTVYKVDKWEERHVKTEKELAVNWSLHLSSRRHCGETLNEFLLSCADRPLSNTQLETFRNLMADGTARPDQNIEIASLQSAPLSFEEAKSLVAKYYLVESNQVSIAIHSK
jgi:hypothetical protein